MTWRNGNPERFLRGEKFRQPEPPSSPPPAPKVQLRIHPYTLGLLLGKGVAILTTLGAAACFAWAFWSTAPWSVVALLLTLILSTAIVFSDSAKSKIP